MACTNMRALYVFSSIDAFKLCVCVLIHMSVYHLCVCVSWPRSKASLTSQHGVCTDPLSFPSPSLQTSSEVTGSTGPITAGRCDRQPPTPRTPRVEGLEGEDKRGVNKGL